MERSTRHLWTDIFAALMLAVMVLAPGQAAGQLSALDVSQDFNKLSNGGFEAASPAYWEASGDGAVWSTEEARTPNYSLALQGAGEAAWTQPEAVRNWVPRIIGNQAITVGGYVKTDGVNTNPGSEAEKFQLVFEFFGEGGSSLVGPVVIDVPQDQATSDGWVRIDNTAQGVLSLPENATSATIAFRKGADATGTAYLDDIFLTSEGDEWPGGFFNTNMDAGAEWYYWWSGFDQGSETWPESQPFFQTVTTAEARTGERALRLEQNDPDASESVAISERVPVTPNEPVLVSFWVKTEGVMHPDSIGKADYNIGLTALWYDNLEGGAAGWGEIGGVDIRLNGDYNPMVIPLAPREEATGWTQYAFVVYPAEGAVGMELRLRYWHHFEGTTYWDDVTILNLGDALTGTSAEEPDVADTRPERFRLEGNFPNPFRTTTRIRFYLAAPGPVQLRVYDVHGRAVAGVDAGWRQAGAQEIRFDGSGLPSGLYAYILESAGERQTGHMVLVR